MLKLLLKMRRIKREMEMFIFNSAFGQYEEYLLKKEAVSYERLKRKTGRLNRNNFISDNIKISPCKDDLKNELGFGKDLIIYSLCYSEEFIKKVKKQRGKFAQIA
jgi:hypothetical protein